MASLGVPFTHHRSLRVQAQKAFYYSTPNLGARRSSAFGAMGAVLSVAALRKKLSPYCGSSISSALAVRIEVHPDPDHALSDGAQSLDFVGFEKLFGQLKTLAEALGRKI